MYVVHPVPLPTTNMKPMYFNPKWKGKKIVWRPKEVHRLQHISPPITRQHITERHPGQQAASSSAIAHSGPGGPQMSDWSHEQWQWNRMNVLYDWPLSTNIRPPTRVSFKKNPEGHETYSGIAFVFVLFGFFYFFLIQSNLQIRLKSESKQLRFKCLAQTSGHNSEP